MILLLLPSLMYLLLYPNGHLFTHLLPILNLLPLHNLGRQYLKLYFLVYRLVLLE